MKRKAFTIVLALMMLLAYVPSVPAMATDYTATLEADSATRNNSSTSNYGASKSLRIRANDYFSAYFRFDISQVQGYVSSAKLYLTPQKMDAAATDISIKIAVAETSQWTEGNLDGENIDLENPQQADFLYLKNRPAFDQQAYIAEASPVQANQAMCFTIPIDVIEAARNHEDPEERNKITLVAFVNGAADQNTAPNVYVYTKENGNSDLAPKLLITGEEEMSDDIVVATDKSRLALPNLTAVTGNLSLPSTGYSKETQISWNVEGDGVSLENNTLVVTRPAADQPNAQAELIAEIRKGDASAEKRFPLTILSLRYPQENTMVQDGSQAANNFGAQTTVSVRTETTGSLYQLAFFKFDLTYLQRDIDTAKLRLTLANKNTGFQPSDLRVAYSPVDDWVGGTMEMAPPDETSGIIWRDKPFFERTSTIVPICEGDGTQIGDVYEFDVTALAEREYLHDGILTLAVYSERPDATRYTFYSSRSEVGRPELVVTETQEPVYITNNAKKITDGYSGGVLRISAQMDPQTQIIAAQYQGDTLLSVGVSDGYSQWQTAQLTLDTVSDTNIKLLFWEMNHLEPVKPMMELAPTTAFTVEKRYPGFAPKAATFSFDDGVIEDEQLIAIFNQYGIKGTFNLNSNNHTGDTQKPGLDEEWVHTTYAGHEVANHVKNHPNCSQVSDEEFIQMVQEGKEELTQITGYDVTGMAWPLDDPRNMDETNDHTQLLDYIQSPESGIAYARPSSPMRRDFALPEDYYYCQPTIKFPDLDVYGKAFMQMPDDGTMRLLYVWGHAYEFPQMNNWYLIEDFGELVENKPDEVYLATNIEVVTYLKAMEQLEIEQTRVTNHADIPLYIRINGVNVMLEPGETVEQ